ncbi:GNAT family N-acetyltransferase, partial [Candidatus Saccharibacteria bacterium]|nr:GNAT family N-acetyltransferase [Candidatus Saccharibacteria bacterium]
MAKENHLIERVTEATAEVSSGIGQLMPDLSERLQNEPVDMDLLASIIESPDRDLFLARVEGRIVGSAVMNLIVFTSGKKAWLEDFVVSQDPAIRGTGVG